VNAIEAFDGEGGEVTVRFLVDSDIRLQVRDTGCGIPAEFRAHLFEPFSTRKPQGTGLGLFLSRNFMRRFGGDVRLVESIVGRGSCIEILFPRPDQEVS
jgi:signal transduction histidine kinase